MFCLRLKEMPHNGKMPRVRGNMQRCLAMSVSKVDISPCVNKKTHHVQVALVTGPMKRCTVVRTGNLLLGTTHVSVFQFLPH